MTAVDLDRVKEELEQIGPLIEGGYGVMVSEDSPLVAAARLLVEGEQVEWCETHGAEATDEERYQPDGQCWKWRFKHAPGLCRIVSRLLVDPDEGDR